MLTSDIDKAEDIYAGTHISGVKNLYYYFKYGDSRNLTIHSSYLQAEYHIDPQHIEDPSNFDFYSKSLFERHGDSAVVLSQAKKEHISFGSSLVYP